jgi:hypothetical protein
MQKPRTCPHCKKTIPVNRGFYFDEKLNLICGNCQKIAFPTSAISPINAIPYDLVVENKKDCE